MKISLKCLFENHQIQFFLPSFIPAVNISFYILKFSEHFFSRLLSLACRRKSYIFIFQHPIERIQYRHEREGKKGGGTKRGNWILKQYHHHREFPPFPFSSNLICNLVQEMGKHHESVPGIAFFLKENYLGDTERYTSHYIGSSSHLSDPLPLILIIKVLSESKRITSHCGDIKREILKTFL